MLGKRLNVSELKWMRQMNALSQQKNLLTLFMQNKKGMVCFMHHPKNGFIIETYRYSASD